MWKAKNVHSNQCKLSFTIDRGKMGKDLLQMTQPFILFSYEFQRHFITPVQRLSAPVFEYLGCGMPTVIPIKFLKIMMYLTHLSPLILLASKVPTRLKTSFSAADPTGYSPKTSLFAVGLLVL